VEALEALPDSEIVEALDALPHSLRMTVYYADVCGHRYREIAEIMGIPVGTVMSRLHSARRRLRMLLTDLAGERGLPRSRVDTVPCTRDAAVGLSTTSTGAARE
jgi:RNA polymerase sigma-70 factor (ECF subfamily)